MRAAARSALMKLRALRMPSMYIRMLWVLASETRKSRISPKSTSVDEPIDTTLEKPTSLLCAQSRIAVHSAPDCDTKAMSPVFAPPLLKVAFRPIDGRMMPRQFGPIRRML